MKKGNGKKAFTTMRIQENSIVPHFILSFIVVWDKTPRRQGNLEKSFNLKMKILSWCLGALVVDSPGGLS
jgi:hypothetical protein